MADPTQSENEHLPTHVAVCAERYRGIADKIEHLATRLSRLEYILWALLATLVVNGDGPLTRLLLGVFAK